jgi:hypothetical protein
MERRSAMIVQGRVQNGVVVPANGVHLPEGQTVTIVPFAPSNAISHGVLDIPTVSLGGVLFAESDQNDLLAEMLEGRK